MQKQISYIFLLFLIGIVSYIKPTEERLTMLDLFPKQENTDSTFVFSLDTITSFSFFKKKCDLYNEISVKKQYLRYKDLDIPFNTNVLFDCSNDTYCIKMKNIIKAFSDKENVIIDHPDTLKLNVFNAEKHLRNQLFNFGKNPSYSDSPEKYFISLEFLYNKFPRNEILQQVDTFSLAYFNIMKSFNRNDKIDSLTKKYPFSIRLVPTYLAPKQPPYPPKPAQIEIIE